MGTRHSTANPTAAETGNCIEVLVRGVCCLEDKLLLCRNRRVGNLYLPGGHVDFGEPARQALAREILEELGRPSRVGRFLGACEHAFTQDGGRHAEINLVFTVEIEGISASADPEPRENWLQFEWQELSRLGSSGMEPATLRDCLPRWLAGADHDDRFRALPPEAG